MASLVNHSVNNLINGVSQQATSVRLDNQFEEQINCFSDITKGLTIRNPLELMNIIGEDISNRNKIEFSIDGQKYLLGLDTEAASPLIHIPLTADVTALSASITSPSYFTNTSANDLRIIESKDKVYVLNRGKTVGTSRLKSSFTDINIINDRTLKADTDWDSGSYTLTLTAVADTETTATVTESPIDILVTESMTHTDIANAINATSITNETGVCFIIGDKGSYRIHFTEIPLNFVAPTVSVVETSTIQGDNINLTSSTFDYNLTSGEESYVHVNLNSGYYTFYWEGTYIGNHRFVDTFKVGAVTYYAGVLKTTSSSTHRRSIQRVAAAAVTDDYTIELSSSEDLSSGDYTADRYSDKGMVWVTGVAQNQEYDLTIEYEDTAGVAQTAITIASVSVGTTVGNIKLNWVIDQIHSKLNGVTTADPNNHFSTTVYDNAIRIYSTTAQAYNITAIKVSNNFDNSSISSVINATLTNESAVQDITTLPPLFEEGFKIRVGNEDVLDSNYYLKYNPDFQGWKECGLDESRVINGETMPYVIDKEAVRKTGVIVLEPLEWVAARAGDDDSNPYPSFVDKQINDIFFYGSRLGFATDDTIVMSKIDSLDTFFRTTASRTLTNERVDIKLDNSKLGYSSIKDVITANGKLIVNTGTAQAVLRVNTAFDLSTARLEPVSSYSLGVHKPLPINNGIYFSVTVDSFSNVYNYIGADESYQAQNITKHIPQYIVGTTKQMGYAENCTVLSVEEDLRTLYIQNRFSDGNQVLQNAWHKWTLPFDLEHFYFDNNTLYVIMTGTDSLDVVKTLITKYELTPQIVTESSDDAYIGWQPYLDCWTNDKTLIEDFSEFIGINDRVGVTYATVASAYASTQYTQIDTGAIDGPYFDESPSEYYWEVDGNAINLVWGGAAIITVGNSAEETVDYGGFSYTRGDVSATEGRYEISRAAITETSYEEDEMVYGVPFTLSLTFSEVLPRQQSAEGFVVMNYARLMLRRMRLLLNDSSVFQVAINFADRQDYSVSYTGQPLGKKILGRGSVSDINFNFPINGKSDKVEISLTSDSSTPFNLLSYEWQGQLITKGRNI